MSRPPIEFTDYRHFKSKPVDGFAEGRRIRLISQEGNFSVRVSEFEPGTDTSSEGAQVHDYWEEVYIIEGSLIDLELNEEFTQGMVASRPPGMKHGPWISPNGCKMFEVTYPDYST